MNKTTSSAGGRRGQTKIPSRTSPRNGKRGCFIHFQMFSFY